MGDFVHLHLHSEYSLLDGACRIKDIPQRVRECGHDAVAVTDHGVMYGAVEFYLECKKNNVKPIIGCEVYVAQGSRFNKSGNRESHPDHLVLLCKNDVGYKNLIFMVSKAFCEGFYSKPRIDLELLRGHAEGLIALSACMSGAIPRALLKGDFDGAVKIAEEYSGIFGKDNFYIEIQNHGLEAEMQVLPELIRLSEVTSLPVVATNDCHYLRRTDSEAQEILSCISTGKTLEEGNPLGFTTEEFYYKSTDEMRMLFGKYEGALSNTVKIAEMCNFDFNFDNLILPKFNSGRKSAVEQLNEYTYNGLEKRLESGDIVYDGNEKTYLDRLKYELSVIESMGYSDYFLIVADYVNYARSRDIPVGPGRGSAAGSLVAYCMGITDIDPIRFGLLFEIFLNPERISMPDIDMDFCYQRRNEVIDYVTEKYGDDHVSQIVTFGTLAARAAVRDIGRVMGMPYSDVDVIARAIPQELNMTIDAALQMPDLKALYSASEKNRKLIDMAKRLEGMPRNVSVHAAGVVITDAPISDYVPLAVSNGVTVTQYDMDTIAKLGLLKFDFLGLRYLTIIDDAVKQIKENDPEFDIKKIPLDDDETYKLIASGRTSGIFQLESAGMRQMLMSMKPEKIDDIYAAISLYRPGPMESIPQYIENRRDQGKIEYDTDKLESILSPTYGCIIYQEQVLSIFRELAGYSYGHADIVRRAMSKKKVDVMEDERVSFIEGAEKNGIDKEIANSLFDKMSSFANYAFKKGHAAAYSVITYQTAYLKTHYMKEYFSALLTSVLGNTEKMAEYFTELAKFGIKILPPDINRSMSDFHVSDGDILYGLLALKNISRQFSDSIISERSHGEYRSFDDFVNRIINNTVNKRQFEVLIKAGTFDRLGISRSRLLASYEGIIDSVNEKKRRNVSGQIDMFSTFTGTSDSPNDEVYTYKEVKDFTLRETLLLEKEASGLYFSGHIADSYSKCLESNNAVGIAELIADAEANDGKTVKTGGVVNSVTLKTTKKNERMAFITIEDRYGSIECIVFPKYYQRFRELLYADSAVLIDGQMQTRDENKFCILVSDMMPLVENGRFKENKTVQKKADTPRTKRLFLRVKDTLCEEYKKCVNLSEIFEGSTQVVFYDSSEEKYVNYGKGMAVDDFILNELKKIIGSENVVFK